MSMFMKNPGEYVLFLNADVSLHEGRILTAHEDEKLYFVIDENGNLWQVNYEDRRNAHTGRLIHGDKVKLFSKPADDDIDIPF